VRARTMFWSALILLVVFALAGAQPSLAQSHVAGSYVCAHANVAGKTIKCSSPPLVLNSDGSYQLHGQEGHYSVSGQWLVLSHTKNPSRGEIQTGHRIVFRYRDRGKPCEIVFERRRVDLGNSSLS
jgi:hypothetical protein